MFELERDAAEKYLATESSYRWDRWLLAVATVSKFLGLDVPTKICSERDAEAITITIKFDMPEPPRMNDARYDVIALEDQSLMDGE